MPPRRTGVVLGAILALEAALYGPNLTQFFCGDSVYWFSRLVQDWPDLAHRLRTLDDLGQHRPLTFVFFTYLVHPIAGIDPLRNHLFPLLFHGLNTLLVYRLSLRILPGERESLTAAFVFGVSTVAAYVTYDNTFIPDYLFVFFYLASLLALPLPGEARFWSRGLAAFALFILALFTKEAAVTYPAAAAIYLTLAGCGRDAPGRKRLALALAPFAAVAAAHVLLHLSLKGGSLYPADPNQPHRLDLAWTNVGAKLRMIAQALWLPLHLPVASHVRGLLMAAVLPLVAWIGFALAWGLARGTVLYAAGVLWFAVTLAPALLVSAPTWEHNVYLPLVGFAWVAAAALERLTGPAQRAGLAYAVCAVVATTAVHAAEVRRSSWMALGSKVTGDCLADLRRMLPLLEPNTLLYVDPTREHNIGWHFDSGRLPATFYRDPSLRMRFAGDGRPQPTEKMLLTGKVIVLKYIEGHLYDVTARRIVETIDLRTFRVRQRYKGKGAVRSELAAGGSARETLAVEPGTRFVQALPPLEAGSLARFGVAVASSRPDRVAARVMLRGPTGARRLWSGDVTTSDGWNDAIVSLSEARGAGFALEVAVDRDASTKPGTLVHWSPLEIVPPDARRWTLPPRETPPQPTGIRITPAPMKRGGTATIEVFGGQEMEVDCRYRLDTEGGKERMVVSWLTTDAAGRQQLPVNRAGRYRIVAIRNALRSDWVPIDYEWVCLR